MRLMGLFGFYAKSPFALLQEHGEHVVAAARYVIELTRAFVDGDVESVERIRQAITDAEHAADAAKNQIRSSLPKGLFLPVDRRDLLHFLSSQDTIADLSQDLGALMSFRRIEMGDELPGRLSDLAETTIETMKPYGEIVSNIGDLYEASFRGPQARAILELIEQVGQAESNADRAQWRAARILFTEDFPGRAVELFLLSKIIDRTSGISDAAERASNRLRVMLSL